MSLPKIGILQGRLTASKDGSIQFFPFDNWEKEFEIASMVGFDCIELLVKRDSYERNPLWSAFDVGRITRLSKKFNISIPSVHGFYIKSPEYTDLLIELIKQSAEVGAKKVKVILTDGKNVKTYGIEDDLTEFDIEFFANKLKEGENYFSIKVNFEDNNGKAYSAEEKFSVVLEKLSFFQKIIKWFQNL